ncbi:hypothetical protein ACSVH7_14605 [Flavobacterium sp. TSSA_36]
MNAISYHKTKYKGINRQLLQNRLPINPNTIKNPAKNPLIINQIWDFPLP